MESCYHVYSGTLALKLELQAVEITTGTRPSLQLLGLVGKQRIDAERTIAVHLFILQLYKPSQYLTTQSQSQKDL